MPDTPLVEKTAKYVKQKLLNEPTGHDWYHVERVWRLARRIQEKEGGDSETIALGVLLHDLSEYSVKEFNEKKEGLIVNGIMDVLGIDEPMKKKVLAIIRASQYNGDDTKSASALEARVVQDANWLDAMGAIGIARVFATGGLIQRPIHDPSRKVRRKLVKQYYRTHKKEGTSINCFYEKIFRLPGLLNTDTAKQLAKKRMKYMEEFIEQFKSEWIGEK